MELMNGTGNAVQMISRSDLGAGSDGGCEGKFNEL